MDTRWSIQRKRGYRFTCDCGSPAAAPLVIPEPVGAVCLRCRRDAVGLVWPTAPYDRYVAHPGMWAAHGLSFDENTNKNEDEDKDKDKEVRRDPDDER